MRSPKNLRAQRTLKNAAGRAGVAAGVAAAFIAAGAAWLWIGRGGADALSAAKLTVQPGAAAGWNLLLLTLDTTRADRLGCYGYQAAETLGGRSPVAENLASCCHEAGSLGRD